MGLVFQMLQSMRRQFSQLLFDMGFIVSPDPKSSDSNRNTGLDIYLFMVEISGDQGIGLENPLENLGAELHF